MKNLQKKAKTIAIYLRTARVEQENTAIIKQFAEIKQFASLNGYKITKTYTDNGYGGNMINRPGLNQLRKDATKGFWAAVAVYDRSRLAHTFVLYKLISEELEQKGIQIISVTGCDNASAEDLRFVFATWERMRASELIKEGLAKKNNIKKTKKHG